MTDEANKPPADAAGKKDAPKNLRQEFRRAASLHPTFFPAKLGIDAQKYARAESATYAAVSFFPEHGWIHGVHAEVAPDAEGGVAIGIDHWVHRPDGENIVTRFLDLRIGKEAEPDGDTKIVVQKAVLQGKELNVADGNVIENLIATCQDIMGQLRKERSTPMLAVIAEKNGLKTRPLPATYKDGEARLAYESGKKIRRFLRVPEKFLPALTGFGEDGAAAKPGTSVLYDATQDDPDAPGKEYTLYAQMQKGGEGEASAFSLRLAREQENHEKPDEPYVIHPVARLTFKPCTKDENKGLTELREVEINDRMLPLSEHTDAVRALNFLRDSAMAAKEGVMPDMVNIIDYTNLQHAISGTRPLSHREGQRYTFRVLGGTPSGPRLFKEDNGIGANCFLHLFEWYDDKAKYNSEAVMVDCGITPLNRDKTGFDGMLVHAGEYFEHRSNPKHHPKHKVSALAITHHHIDHYGGVPHLLLAGYKVDHIICNAATRMYIEKDCTALGVPKEFMPKKWTVVAAETDVRVGKLDLSFGWIPHSAITNWVCAKTAEGRTFHFSDAKVDDTVPSHPAANPDRIAAQKPTMAVLDSTRAGVEEQTKSAKEVEDEIVAFLNENPDKGAIAFHLGGNAERMATFVNAYGRTGRHTVIFGAAKQFLYKVLNTVGLRSGFGLKAHALKEYGTQVLNYTPRAKGANEVIKGPLEKQGILGTGTHNEPMSVINRLLENKDRKKLGFITPQTHVVILSQEGIAQNKWKWDQVEDWLRRRGFQYRVIHASGHEGKKGIEKMLDWAKAQFGVATHGDSRQRGDSEKIMVEKGMGAINPAEQDVIQVSDAKGCKIIAQEPSTMIYFSIKRPEGQYWGDGTDVEYFPYSVRPEIRTPVGEMLTDIHKIKRNSVGPVNYHEKFLHNILERDPILNSEGTTLKPFQRRVNISLPDTLVQNGILRRIIYDCETTQIGRYAWITQLAGRRTDWSDNNERKYINIRQTLPRTVLPDLAALVVTGVKPSDLYKTGENYYPPRQFYHEFVKFLQDSRKFVFKGAEGEDDLRTRVWIDRGAKPGNPAAAGGEKGGDDHDPYMTQTLEYEFDKEKAEKFKDPHAIAIKTLIGGFNNTRADDPWVQHAGFRAGALRYSPTNTGGMRRIDLRNMARMFAYLRPDEFKVNVKPKDPAKPNEPEFLDFSVKGVMEANKLTYDNKGAHTADADADMTDDILTFMLGIDAELFTQTVLNSDPKEVKRFLAGTHNGMLYARSLITYVNSAAAGARANIGVYVGRSTDAVHRNKALLFNVSDFDPRDFENLSAQQLAEIMRDTKHRMNKAFEVVQINKQPLIASADRGLSVGANRGNSIEAMKRSKHFIERNPQFAAKMVKAMEIAKFIPDRDFSRPMEERVYSPPFMEMSAHDKELAKLFEPNNDLEFTDKAFAFQLNQERARALDKFHSVQARERYVAVLYQAEREYKQLFGKGKDKKLAAKDGEFLHPRDRAREQAKERARIHGLIDTSSRFEEGAVSLGMLEAQIREARTGKPFANGRTWDELMADKTPEQRELSEAILRETEGLVQDIKMKIANGDPDWALSDDDFALLGLDDSKPYGGYRAPLEENPVVKSERARAARAQRRAPGPG